MDKCKVCGCDLGEKEKLYFQTCATCEDDKKSICVTCAKDNNCFAQEGMSKVFACVGYIERNAMQ
jgi:hypothetical protein